jgi:hypothetical protein
VPQQPRSLSPRLLCISAQPFERLVYRSAQRWLRRPHQAVELEQLRRMPGPLIPFRYLTTLPINSSQSPHTTRQGAGVVDADDVVPGLQVQCPRCDGRKHVLVSLFNVKLLSMFGGQCALTSISVVGSDVFVGTSSRSACGLFQVTYNVSYVMYVFRMMIRMQLEAFVNYQATLALTKIRLVALQNDAIRSGRVALLSCGCPSNITAVVTHADLSRQNLYISGCSDGSLGVWDRSKKALVRVQHTGIPISSLAAAPSGSFYAVGHETGMLSFWNCKDLLAGKEAPLKSMSSSATAVPSQHQIGSSSYHLTLTLLAGCSPIPASYCRVTLVGDVAEASASLFYSIDGARTLQAGVPFVFKIVSPSWLGPLSKVTLAVDSIAADVRSMFSHVTVSCGDDVRFTFKPQGESAPAPSLTYLISDKSGTASQDFVVHVYTGGDFGAGTDSKIMLIVKGIQGEARLALRQSLTHADPFERGHHDLFLFSLQPSERVGEVCYHTSDCCARWQPAVASSFLSVHSFCDASHTRYLTSPSSPKRVACFPSGCLITYRCWTRAWAKSTLSAHSSNALFNIFLRSLCIAKKLLFFLRFPPRQRCPASLTCIIQVLVLLQQVDCCR